MDVMQSLPTPSQINFQLAPMYFGLILSGLFLSFVGMQLYAYTTHYPRDPMWLKSLVYLSITVMLAHAGIDIYLGYATLVKGWGDEAVIKVPPQLDILGPAFNAFVALCVQNFFVWRIWAFKKTILFKVLCAVITMLSILQVIGGIGIPASFFNVDDATRELSIIAIYSHLWLICGMTADILIIAAMVLILREARFRTSLRSTRNRLGTLIRLTIQTGSLTTLMAAYVFITFLFGTKVGLLQTLPGPIVGPSYVLSLLANLNFRDDGTHNNVHTDFLSIPDTIRFTRHLNSRYESSGPSSAQATLDSNSALHGSDIVKREDGVFASAV